MKTRIILLISVLLSEFVPNGFSQIIDAEKKLRDQKVDSTLGWKRGGVFAINLSQTSLTNWAAGGQNSFATNGLFSSFINYKSEKSSWVNSLDMGYGVIKQGGLGYRKTDDKFDFLSKYGRQAFDHIYYAALLNFKTQFSAGYNYPNDSVRISNFMAPAYLIGALGFDYKPNAYFSAFVAPVTLRLTIVNDRKLSEAGAFGVTPGDRVKSEFGGYIRVIYSKNDFKSELLKNISFTTKIDLFSNYIHNPQNIVVNWETLLAMKVNRFISANINTQLIYDDKVKIPVKGGKAVGSKVQFKEILGAGLSYKF
jgi:hypothetical protein